MKTIPMAALAATVLVWGAADGAAQQREPAPAPGPPAAAPRRPGPPGPDFLVPGAGRVTGFAVGMFNPTMLLSRRETLSLTAEQVTRLSALENELKAAGEKAAADAKPHREELEKLLKQSAPDVAQVRTHAQALMQVEQAARLTTLTTALQAKAVLNAEQRGRVQGWAEGGRRGGAPRFRRGPGPDGGPGGSPRPAPPVRFRRGVGGA